MGVVGFCRLGFFGLSGALISQFPGTLIPAYYIIRKQFGRKNKKGNGGSSINARTSPVSAGARVCDPQRVASSTDAGTNLHVILRTARCGSQSRAPKQAWIRPMWVTVGFGT